MDAFVGTAWLIAGMLVGVALGLWFGPARARQQSRKAKIALADSQQRRALERMREQNLELAAQMESSAQRHSRALEALSQSHAAELRLVEEELRQVREQLNRMLDAAHDGSVISGTAFVPTQFSDPD
jgi:DNA primase large subunit